MEDPLQLRVGSIQEAVRSGRPLLIDGRHGWHVALQTQEVFLHLREHRGKNREDGTLFFWCFFFFCGDLRADFFRTHNSLDGEVVNLLAGMGPEELPVLPADLYVPTTQRQSVNRLSAPSQSRRGGGVGVVADHVTHKQHCSTERRRVSHRR